MENGILIVDGAAILPSGQRMEPHPGMRFEMKGERAVMVHDGLRCGIEGSRVSGVGVHHRAGRRGAAVSMVIDGTIHWLDLDHRQVEKLAQDLARSQAQAWDGRLPDDLREGECTRPPRWFGKVSLRKGKPRG